METVKNIQPSFLELSDKRRIAYHVSEGKTPGVVFLGGFKSDMTGTKALALEAFCQSRGQRFLRFDYTGHGQSSGAFANGSIGNWKRDALDAIDQLAPGKNILVGSSMGGWLMLLAALERQEQVAGLVGIATAADFTEKLIWEQFDEAQKRQLMEEGVFAIPDCYGAGSYPITRHLIEEGRKHLLLDGTIPLQMPIRLIHGLKDEDVPWQMSVKLAQRLTSGDTRITLVKDAGHRLSEPEQLALICGTMEEMLSSL